MTIPQHLIDKGARAAHAADFGGLPADYDNTPKWYRRSVEKQTVAALAAVAGEIWDQGYIAAEWNTEEVCRCSAWNDSECACGNYGNGHQFKRNPYKETP